MRRAHRRALCARSAIGWSIALAAFLILAGCGSSSSTTTNGSGSGSGSGSGTGTCGTAATCEQTTLTVFSTVNSAFGSALANSGGSATLNGYTFTCPGTGTVSVTGSYTGSNPITYSISLVFSACDTGPPASGELVADGTVTVSGSIDPNTAHGTYNMASNSFSVTGQSNSTPVSFNCPFNIQMTFGSSPTYSVTSTVCGQAYNYTY